MPQKRSRKVLKKFSISSRMKWKKLSQNISSAENFEENFIKISFMTCEDMNTIEIIVETKKFFMTDEKTVSFFIIDFENNTWLDIDLNDSLKDIVNNKRKRFEKASVAMSSSSSTFMKSIHNAELLSSSIILRQITYLKVENRFAKIKCEKLKMKKTKVNQIFIHFRTRRNLH